MSKYCIVPSCRNSTYNMPRKLFISVPKNPEVRKKWCHAIKRPSAVFSPKSTASVFVCEDHFNLKEDLENYVRFSLMGGKLRIKKNVVPHIFSQIKTNTSQIDQKIVDTYNKKFNKFSARKQCKSSISVSKSPKVRRLEPKPEEVINIYDSNIEIKEENIVSGIKEELDNSSSSIAEYNYVFIKNECEDIDEQAQSKMEEIGIEWNANDSNNVSIKTECENTNDDIERSSEEAEFKINNFTNVLIKSECEEIYEQIQSNIEQIDGEYNEMDSTNMSFKTESDTNNFPDGNIIYIKMEPNTDDQFVERLPEKEALPYSNRNIIIVTNGFDTSADANNIENNILIEETNNMITYSQNEIVSVNEDPLCDKNTVYTNGETQNKSSVYDNNKVLSDMTQCSGLFQSEHGLADWLVTCMVPRCNKTKKYNPNTRFFKSPTDVRWERWLRAIYLNPRIFEYKTIYYICEDHFDLPNDVENWNNYQKNKEHPIMKPHVLPSPVVVRSEMNATRRKKVT